MSYPEIIGQVLNGIDASMPRHVVGFPLCQACHRKVTNAFAGTDGIDWFFGHARCTPDHFWMPGRDFEHLAEVLDWAFHLAGKGHLGLGSWIKLVEYVRPDWVPAVKALVELYFTPAPQRA